MIEYWKEFSFGVGAIVTFFAGRKSAKIMERKNNADAVSTMQKTYDTFLTHYNNQYEILIKRLNDLELRNAILLESSSAWEKKFRELEINHQKLKNEFDNYKAKHEQ